MNKTTNSGKKPQQTQQKNPKKPPNPPELEGFCLACMDARKDLTDSLTSISYHECLMTNNLFLRALPSSLFLSCHPDRIICAL